MYKFLLCLPCNIFINKFSFCPVKFLSFGRWLIAPRGIIYDVRWAPVNWLVDSMAKSDSSSFFFGRPAPYILAFPPPRPRRVKTNQWLRVSNVHLSLCHFCMGIGTFLLNARCYLLWFCRFIWSTSTMKYMRFCNGWNAASQNRYVEAPTPQCD